MTGTAPNPATALARVLVDELARGGVRHAVLAPGSRSTALVLALDRHPDVRLHVEVDERSAAFLALGVARVSGSPALAVTTSGTAAANLHPAVIEASAARVPLVALTADRPRELRDTGANQAVDQVKLYGDAVRWFCELGTPEDVPGANGHWRSVASRVVATAAGLTGPPGPVHLNVAFREPTVPETDDGRTAAPAAFTGPLEGRADGAPWTSVRRGVRRPPQRQVAALAERIAATPRGLIVVGDTPCVVGDDHPDAVLALAGAAGWPVLAEPMSGARAGPSALRAGHHLVACPGFAAAHRPDLVLRIGRAVLSRELTQWLDAGVPQVLVDPDGAWLDPGRAVAELVVADVGATCRALAARLEEARSDTPVSGAWLERWRAADRTADGVVTETLEREAGPTEPGVARDVAATVPDGGTLVAGSSMPVRDLDRFMRPRRGLRVIGNRGASGIDGLVSTALGAALASPGPTVALTGDLSLLHDANGLLLDADGGPPDCVLVVVHNDGGGIFHLLPQARQPGFERLFATPHGREPADLARLHGLAHRRIGQAAELGPAVREAVAAGGLHLVEVRTDRVENVALHREIQAAVDAVLAGE